MMLAPPSWGDLGVIASVFVSAGGMLAYLSSRFSIVETKVDLMYKWFQEKVIGAP